MAMYMLHPRSGLGGCSCGRVWAQPQVTRRPRDSGSRNGACFRAPPKGLDCCEPGRAPRASNGRQEEAAIQLRPTDGPRQMPPQHRKMGES
ncbi:hypothetical protein FH972_025723 [Carpinus fangiana]|uniref:Uncharacterized protein n=1 Tax=Carpinus fangiana TaxID=176857 RepID=A0A5N6L2F4_9ROSI|nr:hypothetical protein FH972_025723 [Carpinus fangiana]